MKGSETEPGPKLESLIGLVLRYGVVVSSAVIAVGVILSPLSMGSYPGCPATLDTICSANIGRPDPTALGVLAGLSSLNPLSIIEVGIIILLAIPFFRVAAGGVMFTAERDWRYVAISAFVLGVLLVGTFIVGPFEAG